MANVIQVSDVASGSFVIFFLLCSFQNRQDCQNDLCAYTMCWFQIPPLYVEYVNWLYLWTCFIVSIVCRCDGNMVSWVSIDLDAMEKLTFRFGNPCMISFRLQINCRFNCFGHSLKNFCNWILVLFCFTKKKNWNHWWIETFNFYSDPFSKDAVRHRDELMRSAALNCPSGAQASLNEGRYLIRNLLNRFFLLCKDPHVMNLKSNVWFKIKNWKNV